MTPEADSRAGDPEADNGADAPDALGGRAAVGMVGMIVDGLYDRLERDKELSRLFGRRRQGERETVKALLELGADPNAPNAKGRTALSIATGARFSATVALLLAAGAR